jgi:hypothetical protein
MLDGEVTFCVAPPGLLASIELINFWSSSASSTLVSRSA